MFKTILTTAALLACATADTAPGFPIRSTTNLTVTYGNNTVSPGGELIPRGETAQPPTINSPTWYTDESGTAGPCVLLMVDLDVPRNNTRVQLVHWIVTNITAPATAAEPLRIPTQGEQVPVPYLQPSPPVGDIPHSYTFILLAQPRNFSIPAQYSTLAQNRVRFNVGAFAADTGLTRDVAATWITVQNLTGNPGNTSAYPPPRVVQEGPELPGGEFEGAAMKLGGRALWVGVGTAVVAGVFAVAL